MFRQTANICMGRIKSIDENLDFQKALCLLKGLEEDIRVSVYYNKEKWCQEQRFTLRKITPRGIVDFVEQKFKQHYSLYTRVRHQAYRGIIDEKHYLDFALGEIEGRYGEIVIRKTPFIRASIDYVVPRRK